MKANELRIGNYLMYRDQLTRIESGKEIDQAFEGPLLNPIAISEMWMNKLGFRRENSLAGSLIKGYVIPEGNGEFISEFIIVEGQGGYALGYENGKKLYPFRCREVIYIHELQNLYFVITGQELMIQ